MEKNIQIHPEHKYILHLAVCKPKIACSPQQELQEAKKEQRKRLERSSYVIPCKVACIVQSVGQDMLNEKLGSGL